MKLYKGIADKDISEINHYHKTLGFYGYGIYLTPLEKEARFYTAGFKQVATIVNYELIANLLEIQLSDMGPLGLSERLSSILGVKTIKARDLAQAVEDAGYEGIFFNGFFEGGRQVLYWGKSGLRYLECTSLVRKSSGNLKS